MATHILTVNQEGMTLDLLLWREYMYEADKRVQDTMKAAANLNLTRENDTILTVGTKVEVEVINPDSPNVTVRRVIRITS